MIHVLALLSSIHLAHASAQAATFEASVSQVGAELARMKAEAPRASCPEAREQLERRFQLYIRSGREPISIFFLYKRCEEHGERGQEGPGTVRTYEPKEGGWRLTLTTYEDQRWSDVRLWKGEQYLGRMAAIANDAAASGDWLKIDRVLGGETELRGVPIEPIDRFPQLAVCEDRAAKSYQAARNVSLMMLTEEAAFYYYEDCDICAAVDSCDLKTGRLSTIKAAHSVSCGDITPFVKGKVLIGCR